MDTLDKCVKSKFRDFNHLMSLQYLPGKAQAKEKVAKNREEMFEFYQTLIDEHRQTLDIHNARDLIDVYLIEIEKAKTEGRGGELFEGRDHGKLFFYFTMCR